MLGGWAYVWFTHVREIPNLRLRMGLKINGGKAEIQLPLQYHYLNLDPLFFIILAQNHVHVSCSP